MKKPIITLFLLTGLLISNITLGQSVTSDPNFEIIPKAEDTNVGNDVTEIGNAGGNVWETYNKKAEEYQAGGKIGNSMSTGIFTRSTILDYLVYVIKFMSQLGIFIGALMIIYAGYIYASNAFTGKEASGGKKAISNAIMGVLVITFSYAIMKLVISAFIS